jgi:enamine deaminase RidA (YjgF/YER057c/UK114 family)
MRTVTGHEENSGDDLQFVHPEGWLRPSGYADAIVATGRVVYIAGQVGWDPRTQHFATGNFVEQVRQTLENVVEALRAAGGEPRHLVRLTWFVVDRAEYLASRREVGSVYREVIGMHYPTMSLLVVAGLLEEEARVEIEATAVIA